MSKTIQTQVHAKKMRKKERIKKNKYKKSCANGSVITAYRNVQFFRLALYILRLMFLFHFRMKTVNMSCLSPLFSLIIKLEPKNDNTTFHRLCTFQGTLKIYKAPKSVT